MGAVVAIDALLHERRVWRGRPAELPGSRQPCPAVAGRKVR
jgi:myo-inositol catabolism protein IolC